MQTEKKVKDALTFEQWHLKYAEDIKTVSKRGEDARTQTTVALHRRFRGRDLSDQIGRFILGGTGRWKGDDVEDLEGVDMKCLNVVKPTVKMNMAALASARVAVKNEGANKSPRLRGVANVADGIVKYLDENENHWTGGLQSRMHQLSQTGYGYFVQAKHNPNKRSETVQTKEWKPHQEYDEGTYACVTCGARGPFDRDEENEEPDQIACPVCGDPAEIIKPPELVDTMIEGEAEEFNPGDIETNLSSCLEHRVDERKSQGGNLAMAKWFEHHYLVTEGELYTEFGDFNFGAEGEWCFALKWKWALETGEDVFGSSFSKENYRKRFERRDIYVLPEEYCDCVEPQDYEMKDADGRIVFSIQRGERRIDKFPNGYCFSVVSDKLAPYIRAVDFRNEWSYGCYMPDAHSFWGQPLVELLQVQDDWNTLYTIDVQHRERNSLNQITYNRLMYDADSWEQDLVPTAEGMTQPDGTPLSHYFAQVQSMPMNEAVSGLKFLYELLPYIGGASPPAIGVPAKGRDTTYRAQLLQKQSALGQLQPAADSGANCKVWHFRNFMRLAQEFWPPAQFEYIWTRFGEEWKADDIEAFMEANIDRDVITSFVEGSETPTSLIERRIDMESVLNKYVELGVAPPEPLIRQYFDLLGIDYDMGGMEADERLAEARYEKIREGIFVLGKQGISPEPTITMDPQTGQQKIGPSPLCQAVLSHRGLVVKQRENHKTHVDFYVSKEKALMAQPEPDAILLECIDAMMERHDEAGVTNTQDMAAQEVAGQAPIVAAQQAAAGEQAPPGPDPQQVALEAQQEEQALQAEMADKEAQRDFDAMESERERDHEMKQSDKDFQHNTVLEKLRLSAQERMAAQQAKAKATAAKQKSKQAA